MISVTTCNSTVSHHLITPISDLEAELQTTGRTRVRGSGRREYERQFYRAASFSILYTFVLGNVEHLCASLHCLSVPYSFFQWDSAGPQAVPLPKLHRPTVRLEETAYALVVEGCDFGWM